MSRPRMTEKVRRGLATLAELGRSYLEGDLQPSEDGEGFYPSLGERGSKEHDDSAAEIEAAQAWLEAGGLCGVHAKARGAK